MGTYHYAWCETRGEILDLDVVGWNVKWPALVEAVARLAWRGEPFVMLNDSADLDTLIEREGFPVARIDPSWKLGVLDMAETRDREAGGRWYP